MKTYSPLLLSIDQFKDGIDINYTKDQTRINVLKLVLTVPVEWDVLAVVLTVRGALEYGASPLHPQAALLRVVAGGPHQQPESECTHCYQFKKRIWVTG